MAAAKRSTGFVLYEGPSKQDGMPIVVIALTGKSTNRKTGAMVQTYILRADVDPINAVRAGADVSICGNCKHRGDGSGKGRMVRLGTYGDPAMVPVEVWQSLVSRATGYTGYTHQWTTRPELRGLVMASCDNIAEFDAARAAGWRAFIVRTPSTPVPTGAITCPASEEAGKRTQCAECRLCDGAKGSSDRRKSITIIAHGASKRAFTGAA
jgi:hypothetical protein